MSFAWTAIVVLILLLPGVFFLIGLYSKERYPRDTRTRNPVFPLAWAVSVAFVVHIGYYAFVDPLVCGNAIPCVNAVHLSSALHGSSISKDSTALLAQNFSDFRKYIFSYLIATCVVGFFLGSVSSRLMLKGFFRASSEHPWIRDLIIQDNASVVWAYVLTNIRSNDRILMYKGPVKEFYANAEGQLTYLMLSEAERCYMILDKDYPRTNIASTGSRHGVGPSKEARIRPGGNGSRIAWNNLLIRGDEIANVVFQRKRAPLLPGVADFNALVNRVREQVRDKQRGTRS